MSEEFIGLKDAYMKGYDTGKKEAYIKSLSLFCEYHNKLIKDIELTQIELIEKLEQL